MATWTPSTLGERLAAELEMKARHVAEVSPAEKYWHDRANHLADVLAAILAMPKYSDGLAVPRANIVARLRDDIRSLEHPHTGDVVLYLETRNQP